MAGFSAAVAATTAALLFSGIDAGAGVPNPSTTTITTNYYVFGGTNAAQLRAAMIAARPWKETMNFDAHTKWNIHSSFRYARTNSEHRLRDAEIRTKVEITLPRWIPGKPVPRELVLRWQKCFLGLSVHEQGHLQLALAAGAEVRRRLEELPGFVSTRELTDAANRVLKETLDAFRERERKYDEVTGHGRTQGAIFPVEAEPEEIFNSPAASPGGSPPRQNRRGR